jgi:hypothetical protein
MEFQVSLPCSQSRPLVSIPNQMNPVYILKQYLMCILILSFNLRLGLPIDILPSSFPTKFCTRLSYIPQVLHALPITSSVNLSL